MSTAIFLNGEYEDDGFYVARYREAGLVIAADGGHAFLRRHDLWPQVVIGDFDSLDAALVREACDAGIEVVRHPTRKDATDAELAVAEALARSGDEVVLLGALGGDFDHQLGHISLLRGIAESGRAARIASPGLAVRVLCAPATVVLTAAPGTRVSLVSLSPTAVVTLRGLEYPLTEAPLPATSSLGLSNAVAAPGATVTLVGGVLVIMVCDDGERLADAPPE